MKILGYIFIGIIIFVIGMAVGSSPTTEQKQEQIATLDLKDVSSKYQTLYSLCEQKYQTGIDGDINGAYQIKGQMDVLETQINQILNKYSNKAL